MGRGKQSNGADGPSRRLSKARERIALCLTGAEQNYQWLRDALADYPEEEFADDWLSKRLEAAERVAAVERFYERRACEGAHVGVSSSPRR